MATIAELLTKFRERSTLDFVNADIHASPRCH